jgi:hypothetical protein
MLISEFVIDGRAEGRSPPPGRGKAMPMLIEYLLLCLVALLVAGVTLFSGFGPARC